MAKTLGRPGGPARLAFSAVAVAVIGVLIFVTFNLNTRLDHQQQANVHSIDGSSDIVKVNDDLTVRLSELTKVTETARQALTATSALDPVLVRLEDAIRGAARLMTTTADHTALTNQQLGVISALLIDVREIVVPLTASTNQFGNQAKDLLTSVQGLVTSLEGSVESARRINQVLPVPG